MANYHKDCYPNIDIAFHSKYSVLNELKRYLLRKQFNQCYLN